MTADTHLPDRQSGFTESDERMHAPTNHEQFSESMYFNFIDRASGHSLLVRMGNRVNEGFAEVTVLVYRPGGSAALHFERAPITDNSQFHAGGLEFTVVRALRTMAIAFSGDVRVLANGLALADPKRAMAESRLAPLEFELEYTNLIPVYGLDPHGNSAGGIAGAEDTIAYRHYQVPCRVTGRLRLDGVTHHVDALGYRDHSWGPRLWQAPRYWRWISCICDENNGFVGWVSRVGNRRPPTSGMVLRRGKMLTVNRVQVQSEYSDAPYYPKRMRIELLTDAGTWEAAGRVLALVPLRNRREGTVARIAEAVCEYTFDGLTGYGFSEYQDLIEEGLPAGMTEA